LGIPTSFGDQLDAIYRRDKQGNWIYGNDGEVLDRLHPQDRLLIKHFETVFQNSFTESHDVLYVPLAIGNHVDHVIAFEVGRRLLGKG
jgi:hypothetical protein